MTKAIPDTATPAGRLAAELASAREEVDAYDAPDGCSSYTGHEVAVETMRGILAAAAELAGPALDAVQRVEYLSARESEHGDVSTDDMMEARGAAVEELARIVSALLHASDTRTIIATCATCDADIYADDEPGEGFTTDDDGGHYCADHNADNPTSDAYAPRCATCGVAIDPDDMWATADACSGCQHDAARSGA